MPLNIGRLNRYITIKKRQDGVDAAGQPLTTWVTHRSDWALLIAPTRRFATERVVADRATSPVVYSIRMRYCTDITHEMYVECEGFRYNIDQVIPDFAGRSYTDQVCIQGVS